MNSKGNFSPVELHVTIILTRSLGFFFPATGPWARVRLGSSFQKSAVSSQLKISSGEYPRRTSCNSVRNRGISSIGALADSPRRLYELRLFRFLNFASHPSEAAKFSTPSLSANHFAFS